MVLPAGLFVPTGLVFAQAPDCAALAVAAATALEPEVRSFSLQGLGDCPADPKIARLLNARIPFYRLPEVFKAIPALQKAKTTSLRPLEMIRCLRLKVWDPQRGRLVGFRELGR